MHPEHDDSDPFEAFDAFGDREESREIDLSPVETRAIDSQPFETTAVETRRGETTAIDTALVEAAAPRKIKTGFSWTAFAGGIASLVWIGGAIGGPISYYGLDALMRLDPAMQAGLIALAFGPAILFWLSAAAAGEALKARRVATELTRMAHEQNLPAVVGGAQAQRFGVTVKTEIEALSDAVGSALARLSDLEASARRNAALFDEAIAASRENAEYMASRLASERQALVDLNGELRGQTDTMANSIGRQVRLMREASKLVKTEISAAEEAFESHLQSFSASASIMAEHTASFHDVANDASAATASLNATMSNMLEGLGEATRLTDAARQSAEQATLVANDTANAVRETTRNAVFEAKRAAQAIRAETTALQDAAVTTMEKLREAAQAARDASAESQAAADRHANKIEQRLSALATTASARRVAAAPQEERIVERKATMAPANADEHQNLYAAAAVAASRRQPRSAPADVRPARPNGLKGFGGWVNLFPSARDEGPAPTAANAPEEADAFALVDFGTPRLDPDALLKADVMQLCIEAGVDLTAALRITDLDQIAQASRRGAAARRNAVIDAAPGAVNRIARHLKRDAQAKQIAAAFRSRPDLATSEKKSEGSDLIRAYLLIDAALV